MVLEKFIGIDVSKKSLDVAIRPGKKVKQYLNTPEGVKELIQTLKKESSTLIVMEATGSYHLLCLTELVEDQLPVVVLNPRQVRDFAKATGQLAKTDKIDARVLAHFAEAIRPEVRSVFNQESLQLVELLRRRTQVVQMLTSEKNRFQGSHSKKMKEGIEKHIQFLKSEQSDIEMELDKLIDGNSNLKNKENILKSVPGVGNIVAQTLIAELPELGQISSRQISTLVGVAPLNRDSGSMKKRRMICGGRARVRQMLYMACISAIRWNPILSSFAERLKQSGKPFKVIITAVMHKLLIILNAMIRENTLWKY